MLSTIAKLLRCTSTINNQVRNYAVPKRKMIKKEYFVYTPRMKSRYKGNPNPRLKMLLLEDVENIGMKDDIVEVKRGIGRWNLIPNKLAIYATEENLINRGIDPNRLKLDQSSKVPLNVLKYLQKHEIDLITPLIEGVPNNEWVVTVHDISEYFFRRAALRVPVDCINIVECQDNVIREIGRYTIQVTLNKMVTVDVPLDLKEREEIRDEPR